MKHNCPNQNCLFFQKSTFIIKDGRFKRRDDSRLIQRFRCKNCNKRFSSSTSSLEFRQKKRRVNHQLLKLLASGVSLRRSAIVLGINKETARRKLTYLGRKCRLKNERFRKRLSQDKVKEIQFDDLITKEVSKLLPLSVTIAVDAKRRYILSTEVSQIPSFGHLAKISRNKYGKRKCFHKKGVERTLKSLSSFIDKDTIIVSDMHTNYLSAMKKLYPQNEYQSHQSERAHIAGQGEMKKVRFDPLFAINHTCAMFRANINRLFRKTWCVTKDRKRLQDHIEVFVYFYHQLLQARNGTYLTPL